MRPILAVLLGVVFANVTLLSVGFIANSISPTPPELMDPATQKLLLNGWLPQPISHGFQPFLGSGLVHSSAD